MTCAGGAFRSFANGVSHNGRVSQANLIAGHNAGSAHAGEAFGKNLPAATTFVFTVYDVVQSLRNGDTTDAVVKSIAGVATIATQVAEVNIPGLSTALLASPTVYKEVSNGQYHNAVITVAKTGTIVALTTSLAASAPCMTAGPIAFSVCFVGSVGTSVATSYVFDYFKINNSGQTAENAALLAAQAAQKAVAAEKRAEEIAEKLEDLLRSYQQDNDLNFI